MANKFFNYDLNNYNNNNYNKNNLTDYIKCQKFIVQSELNYHWFNLNLNISQIEFLEKSLECIFNSLEKIADELEKKKLNENI